MSSIRAVADTIHATIHAMDIITRCNHAYCGHSRVREGNNAPVYAGMLPEIVNETLTFALTELPGGPADPRQRYRTAYDNPSFTLHIVSDDMKEASDAGHYIRKELDRTAHIETEWGTINTLSIGPATMTVRSDRPRYDVQQTVTVEFVRDNEEQS